MTTKIRRGGGEVKVFFVTCLILSSIKFTYKLIVAESVLILKCPALTFKTILECLGEGGRQKELCRKYSACPEKPFVLKQFFCIFTPSLSTGSSKIFIKKGGKTFVD